MEIPEGEVRILYGNHSSEQMVPGGVEEVLANSDMLFLEGMSGYADKSAEENFDALIDNIQYSELSKYAKENSLPILLPDSKITNKDIESIAIPLASLVELLISLGIFVSILRKSPSMAEEEVRRSSRRRFLTILGGAGSVYLAAPMASRVGMLIAQNLGLGEEKALGFLKLAEISHPELENALVEFRNLLIAYKMIAEMREQCLRTGKKQNAVLVIGAGHIMIEDIFEKYSNDPGYFEKMKAALLELINGIAESDRAPSLRTLGRLQHVDGRATLEIKRVL